MQTSFEATIGQWFTLADLQGFFVKGLEVPAGSTGLVVNDRGVARSLAPGRHRVVGLWRRLFGRSSRLSERRFW